MRLRLLLISVIFIASFSVRAEEWYPGVVVLKSQKAIRGELAIRYDYEVVLFRVGREMMVFPAHKVQSFYIYDAVKENNRQFISIQLSLGPATFHQFYEVILDGTVSVLRRQRTMWYSVYLEAMDFDYYVRCDEAVTAIQKFRREVFPGLVESTSGALSSFVRENKLKMYRLDDVLLIIDHYNQQQVDKNAVAKNQLTIDK
jgi:hypothetical protein